MTPSGSIVFVSLPYPGRGTDNRLFRNTIERLGLLEQGDVVVVDKGFRIAGRMYCVGAQVHMPVVQQAEVCQFTAPQVELSNKVANKRAHIERGVGRVKTFKILSSSAFRLDRLDLLPLILTVVGGLCNMQLPLRDREWSYDGDGKDVGVPEHDVDLTDLELHLAEAEQVASDESDADDGAELKQGDFGSQSERADADNQDELPEPLSPEALVFDSSPSQSRSRSASPSSQLRVPAFSSASSSSSSSSAALPPAGAVAPTVAAPHLADAAAAVAGAPPSRMVLSSLLFPWAHVTPHNVIRPAQASTIQPPPRTPTRSAPRTPVKIATPSQTSPAPHVRVTSAILSPNFARLQAQMGTWRVSRTRPYIVPVIMYLYMA